jgi:outer membrane protein
MMNKLFCCCLLLAATMVNAQETGDKWDLRRCVEHAMTNNISVKQADIQARLEKLQANQTKMSLYPTLNGQTQIGYSHGLNENPTTGTLESTDFVSGSISLSSGYTLFNWNVRKNNIAAATLSLKAQELNVDKAKNDIALNAANAFLQIMLRREQARLTEVQLKQTEAQLLNTRKLVDAGSQPELNAIQLEAQMARDSSNYLQAVAATQQAIINLKAVLNIDMATPFDIIAPPIELIPVENITDLQPEVVYNLAIANQPQQKVTALQLQAAQKRVLSARGAMYPSVSIGGGLNSRFVNRAKTVASVTQLPDAPTGTYVNVGANRYDVFSQRFAATLKNITITDQLNRNFGQNVGLSINMPIFNGHSARTNWERSKLNVKGLELQNEQELQTLKANIYNVYQDAFSAMQKYNASKRNVEASQKALDFAKKRYDIGLLGTLDYITTQNNLFRAKVEEVSNQYEYIFRLKVLEFYKGQGIRL